MAGEVVCAGADRALVCGASSTWGEVPCKGDRACAPRAAGGFECDDTVATSGDACPAEPPVDYACTPDKTTALACKSGRFELWRACRGPNGCHVSEGRNVHCDTSLAEPDDPCEKQGTFACTADGKSKLVCDGSVFAPASTCRGPEGCRVRTETRRVECDDSIAVESDPCDTPDRLACSADKRAELVCRGRHYVRKRECRRSECRLDGNELFCD